MSEKVKPVISKTPDGAYVVVDRKAQRKVAKGLVLIDCCENRAYGSDPATGEGRDYIQVFAEFDHPTAAILELSAMTAETLYLVMNEQHSKQRPNCVFSTFDKVNFFVFKVRPIYGNGKVIRKTAIIHSENGTYTEPEMALARKMAAVSLDMEPMPTENTQEVVTKETALEVPAFGGCPKDRCGNCHSSTEKLKTCQRCKKMKYCNRECQEQDWKIHKKNCVSDHEVLLENKEPTKKGLRKHPELFCALSSCKTVVRCAVPGVDFKLTIKCSHCNAHYCCPEHKTQDEEGHAKKCKGLKKSAAEEVD